MTCLLEGRLPVEMPQLFEFRDDGRYDLRCPEGHESTTVLQQQRFELLSEMAVHAIVDRYYRDAISSFSASLERCFEFCIRTLLFADAGKDDLFRACWKEIGNQSERQLGAFVSLWAAHFNSAPSLLPRVMIERRNSVIHKGRIPTRSEAVEFGDAVLKVARPALSALHDKYLDAIHQIVFLHIREASGDRPSVRHGTMCIPTPLSLSSAEPFDSQGDVEFHVARVEQFLPAMRVAR